MVDVKKRNRYAGKSPSYTRAGMSAQARAKKLAYDTKYNARPAMKKYRAELNTKRGQLIAKGAIQRGDKRDVAHRVARSKGGSLKQGYSLQGRSKNRGYAR